MQSTLFVSLNTNVISKLLVKYVKNTLKIAIFTELRLIKTDALPILANRWRSMHYEALQAI